ncbi:MAG: hypothetical protein K0S45_1032 [Nitrospira sp.]|jgi:hypothetical protein|nr:hypothetical protein [Nitrospira sp.]
MFSGKFFQVVQMSIPKGLSLIALVLLPLPVSIPLALWLTRRNSSGDDDTFSAQPKHSTLTT